MTKKELDNLSLEDTFEKIDEVMQKLSSDDTSLEDSFALYKSGMDMLSHCKNVIDDVEKKVIILSKEAGEEE